MSSQAPDFTNLTLDSIRYQRSPGVYYYFLVITPYQCYLSLLPITFAE